MREILIVSFQSLNREGVGGSGKLGYHLAAHFHKEGHLNNMVVSSKGQFVTTFPSMPVSFWSRYYLFVLNALWKWGLLAFHRKRHIEEVLFDVFLQYKLVPGVKVLVSTNPYLFRTLQKCKRLNIKAIFIPGNPEENEINAALGLEKVKWKVDTGNVEVYTFNPRVRNYNRSILLFDTIIAHTTVIEASFRKRYPTNEILDCYGLIWSPDQNVPANTSGNDGVFRVMYLAHTVLLKGLQNLLDAWSRIDTSQAELHIGGRIDESVMKIVSSRFKNLKGVTYGGHKSSAGEFLENASIFVCPSIMDGMPVTVLEAAANCVPSIITEGCGVKDLFEDNLSAYILAASDGELLAKQLTKCMANRDQTVKAGQEAHEALKKYSLSGFIRRLSAIILSQ